MAVTKDDIFVEQANRTTDGENSKATTNFELILPPKRLNLPHPEYSTPKGVSPLISVPKAGFQYPNYTPFKLPELVEHHFVDKAIGSDPNKAQLLGAATEVKHFNPAIGPELVGIQLKTLTDNQKNELALLVAERGVVFLRTQELDVHEQIAFGAHFGELHIHQWHASFQMFPGSTQFIKTKRR